MTAAKNLHEAAKTGLEYAQAGLKYDFLASRVVNHVDDFLAQKFAAALVACDNPASRNMLRDLWKEITGKEMAL